MTSGIIRELAAGAKRLSEIKKEFSDLEFKERILELRQLLASAQTEIMSQREQILELEKQYKELEAVGSIDKEKVEIEGFMYDLVDGKPVGLPYCPTCEVSEGKSYRLSRWNDQYSKCPKCGYKHNAATNGSVNVKPPRPARPTGNIRYFR